LQICSARSTNLISKNTRKKLSKVYPTRIINSIKAQQRKQNIP